MRTAVIIVAGFGLWGLCLGAAKLSGGSRPASMTIATAVFAVLWFCAAAWNMWVGVSQAGYSFREELPIFLVIFLVPVVIALVVKWRLL